MTISNSCLSHLAFRILFGAVCLAAGQLPALAADRFAEARQKMVDEAIVREGITNAAVVSAMRSVPRELFVPANVRTNAYYDQALPIGHKQTISPPFIVAYMTETLDPLPDDRVLEIGTGSGYQAAVLSRLVRDVYTIEIVEPLGERAAKVLKDQKYENVHTRIGDGYKGWPEAAPFDKIIVTCSPESVPQPLVEQLREGGKMIVPLGERYEQVFYLFEKKDGALVEQKLLPTLFVPMTGTAEDNRKVKPDGANPNLRNPDFELDEDNDGRPDGWHYQRQLTRHVSGAREGKVYVSFENRDPGRGALALQGFACDGAKIAALDVSLWYKAENLHAGISQHERASLSVQFYDADRRLIASEVIGPWNDAPDWKLATKFMPVPPKAREAILRVGLNGASGSLGVDGIQFRPIRR